MTNCLKKTCSQNFPKTIFLQYTPEGIWDAIVKKPKCFEMFYTIFPLLFLILTVCDINGVDPVQYVGYGGDEDHRVNGEAHHVEGTAID